MNRFIAFALAVIIAVLVFGPRPMSAVIAPDPQASAQSADTPASGSGEFLVIERSAGGQFHVDALVSGQDTRFLVDTGADLVALTVSDAERLGIFIDPASFEPIVQTASGQGYGQRITLERIEIGGRELTGVDAVVVRGLAVNLLGQSVLRRLGKIELQGDQMVIRAD